MIELINIGKRNLECLIEGEGEDTVIIQPGMGCSIYAWMNIVKEICKYAKVIVIHRAGVGNSDEHENGNTTATASEDLFALIEKLNINKKIILVGHSYGGLCVQNFARLHPQIIKGIVLVDSSSVNAYKFNELELQVSDEIQSDEYYIKTWTSYSQYTKEQLKAEIQPTLELDELKLPSDIQERIIDFMITPKLYRSVLAETIDLKSTVRNIDSKGEFPNVPLIILARDYEYCVRKSIDEDGIPRDEAEKIEGLWQQLSSELSGLSNKSDFKQVEGSGHSIHLDKGNVVVHSIKELIYK
ncbi:MAG: alpha/beta hydrolase [Clostridium sp.]|uniref:alpha/beta fold hydrolase n=1 Tax=Clostridium sp. TaxID=1506 RepID=UPI003029C1AF